MSDKKIIVLIALLVVIGLAVGAGLVLHLTSADASAPQTANAATAGAKPANLTPQTPTGAETTVATPAATTASPAAPNLPAITAELARAKEENAQLRQQLEELKRQQAPAQVERAAPIPAAKAPTKTVSISGSAYVVRKSGESSILRGFHVTLIPETVPPEVSQAAFTAVARIFQNDATEKHRAAGWKRLGNTEGIDYGKIDDDNAKASDAQAAKYTQLSAKVSAPMDSAEVLKLLGQTHYVNVIRGMVDSAKIATTTTDVQGSYKFSDAPVGSYIFAMFDTPDGFLMWAVPVERAGSVDLFNDTALAQR